MNNSTIVFLINDDVRAVRACYEPDGKVEIFKTFDPEIGVDDMVVVESGTRHGMTTAKVTEVDVEFDVDTHTHVNWIVSRVDEDAFAKIQQQEKEAIAAVQAAEKRRKKAELRKSLFAGAEGEMKTLTLTKVAEGD